jgi:hypothetical protein
VDFATNITTGSVTIRGDRSAPDDDGFYDGNLTISTGHYRLVPGNVTRALDLAEDRPTVDGIQIEAGTTGAFGVAIELNAGAAATNVTTIKNNRVRNASSADYGIGAASGSNIVQRGTFVIENNLVVGFDVVGIEVGVATNFSPTVNVLHNTVYGDGTASTGILVEKAASTGTAIINVKGNASAGNGSGSDFDSSGLNNATLTTADNAFEDFDLGTTNEIDLGAPTDAWTSPGTTQSSDFTVKNTSSALYNAVNPTLVTTDITDFTRDGTNHDVGAFEFQAGGADATANPTGASATSAVNTPSISGAANVSTTGVSATGQVGTVTVSTVENATANPSGVEATGQAGEVTVTGSANVSPSGVSATAFAGDVTVTGDGVVSVTGVQSTGQAGDVTVSTATDVTAEVTGVSATGFAGDPDITGTAVVDATGASATGQVGDVTVETQDQDATVLVTGVSATAQVGTVTVPQTTDQAERVTASVLPFPRQKPFIRKDVTVKVRGVRAVGRVGKPQLFTVSEEDNITTLLLIAA